VCLSLAKDKFEPSKSEKADLDKLFRIAEAIANLAHYAEENELKIEKIAGEVREKAYDKIGAGDLLNAFKSTTRASSHIDFEYQERVRNHLHELASLIIHQKRVKKRAESDARYQKIYRHSATLKLEEAFWRLFLKQTDAHDILTQAMKDVFAKLAYSNYYQISHRLKKLKGKLDNKKNQAIVTQLEQFITKGL